MRHSRDAPRAPSKSKIAGTSNSAMQPVPQIPVTTPNANNFQKSEYKYKTITIPKNKRPVVQTSPEKKCML